MTQAPYTLHMPDGRDTAFVVASPHSGRFYPESFRRRTVLDEKSIRSSEDAFMDVLVSAAPSLGAPLLMAEYPRAYVDLNRAADEMDPAVVDGISRSSPNPRISSGLGVIPRVVANGRVIYRGKLSRAEAQDRIDTVWTPYHSCLDGLLKSAQDRFGEAILLDFHSMPHEALESVAGQGGLCPEVVLGDRFGASARSDIVDRLEAAFEMAGLSVSRNAPFAGAFVAQHYGRPSVGRHAIQIEIDRSLYMDERALVPTSDFEAVKAILTEVLRQTIGGAADVVPLAAE